MNLELHVCIFCFSILPSQNIQHVYSLFIWRILEPFKHHCHVSSSLSLFMQLFLNFCSNIIKHFGTKVFDHLKGLMFMLNRNCLMALKALNVYQMDCNHSTSTIVFMLFFFIDFGLPAIIKFFFVKSI